MTENPLTPTFQEPAEPVGWIGAHAPLQHPADEGAPPRDLVLDPAMVAAAIGLDVADVAPERDEEAAAATPAAAPPPPEQAPRTPAVAGTFAVYDDGQGGIMLVIGCDGQTHHKHIPAALVKMGEKMMGGNSPFAALFGGLR